ncbi:MAG: transcriptional repressor [candidate division Zixibacteria bacterium]|nr:transcriptional repressor [candidate division Zixibacteria bacterium]
MNIDAHQRFSDFIKSAGLKGTEQRAVILDAFLGTDAHVSVDDLHHIISNADKKVGYATVHRTMKLIAECGLAREVMFNDGISRFENTLDSSHHHHLICNDCGQIIEFSSKVMEIEEKRLAKKYDFEIESHHFKIFGICKSCRDQKKRNNSRTVL